MDSAPNHPTERRETASFSPKYGSGSMSEKVVIFSSALLTLASPASVVGAACAPAQDVTDAIVGWKLLLDYDVLYA